MPVGSNIFTYLDNVRDRHTMYVHRSISELECQIWGYYQALRNHGVVEPVPGMTHHFLSWLSYRTKWSTSCGWAKAIEMNVDTFDKQISKFFKFVDEYRKLRPTILCRVRLRAHHVPTGKRVVIGLDGRIEKPKRLEIIRYRPAPLHFLRFHYTDRVEDGWLLMKRDGSYKTSLRDAKQWAFDELQIKRDEWESPE